MKGGERVGMSTQQLKQKGFTIIEVVLVLAIAALIFLMVFIALPALQRNQRDQDRKTVAGKVASAVTTYQSNKRGNQPGSASDLAGFVDGEDDGSGNVLIGNEYTLRVNPGANGVGSATTETIQVFTRAKCNDEGDEAVVAGASPRNAAIIVQMENGDVYFCQSV